MSVLCQQIIPAEYAFVIHTSNPITNSPAQIYAEVVVGMGETLVGAYEGQGLAIIIEKTSEAYEIVNFPNKSVAEFGQGNIFRSDSNAEDLPGLAGAGLFDSIPMVPLRQEVMQYKDQTIFKDSQFRQQIIKELRRIGIMVERIYSGQAQDIEGVIYQGRFYVVQSRPQVQLLVLKMINRFIRSFGQISIIFKEFNGTQTEVQAQVGENLLEIAHKNQVQMEGACEGSCACSTCHVILQQGLYDSLPEASEDEEDMLDLAFGLTPTSRLGCQVIVDASFNGTIINLPEATVNFYVDGHKPKPH